MGYSEYPMCNWVRNYGKSKFLKIISFKERYIRREFWKSGIP
jgi:hypothetical protein